MATPFAEILTGALKSKAESLQKKREEEEKTAAEILRLLVTNPEVAAERPDLLPKDKPRLSEVISTMGDLRVRERQRAKEKEEEEERNEETQELIQAFSALGVGFDDIENLLETEGSTPEERAALRGEVEVYKATQEAEREAAKPKAPRAPSKVDLAIAAARGEQWALDSLEFMSREPTVTQQQVQPYVEALKRGEITITAVPTAVRDEVLASAHGQGVNIFSDAERQQILQFEKIKPLFHKMADLSEKINTGRGVVERIRGTIAKQRAKANLDIDVAEYLSLLQAFSPLVARALGEKEC